MKYREALKKMAFFALVGPLDRGLWREIRRAAGELLVALVELVGRLGAIVLYPVAVPILAALVVAAERHNDRERQRIEREFRAAWEPHRYEPRELRAGKTTSP